MPLNLTSVKEQFQKRKTAVKRIWNVLMLISVIITAVLICLAVNDQEAVNYIIALYILGTWDIFCFAFWLCTLIGVKFQSYSYKEHDISFYIGWSCAFLLLDDAIVDKHTGSFFGASPLECDLDGEKVHLKVGAFTFNSYTLRVGNTILH